MRSQLTTERYGQGGPVTVFYSYSHRDINLRRRLETHLTLLQSQGAIAGWHDRMVSPGTDWDEETDAHLNTSDLILLLVSADFLASRYCCGVEMKRAMERHESRDARVVPIILRPSDWHSAPFGKLNALPTDGKPVTKWKNRDEAFLDVTTGIRAAVESLRVNRNRIEALENSAPASAAVAATEQAAERFHQANDRRSEAMALLTLGLAYRDREQWAKALLRFEEAATIFRELGDRRNEGVALMSLGLAYDHLGKTDQAADRLEAAVQIFRLVGDRYNADLANMGMGTMPRQSRKMTLGADGFEVRVPAPLAEKVALSRETDGWTITIRTCAQPRWNA